METGVELIAKEREQQISKHGRTIEKDLQQNNCYQLAIGAAKILAFPAESYHYEIPPNGWDIDLYKKNGKQVLYRQACDRWSFNRCRDRSLECAEGEEE